jgi:hypothetical protein
MTGNASPIELWLPAWREEWLALAAVLTTEQLGALFRLRLAAWGQSPPCTLPNSGEQLGTMSGLGARWMDVGEPIRDMLRLVDTARGPRLLDPALLARYDEQLERHRIASVRRAAGAEGGKRSAAVRDNRAPSKPGSNGRSKAPVLLRGVLSSVVSSEKVQSTEHAEANAEANHEAKAGDGAAVNWRELVDPVRAAAEAGR